MKMSIWTYFLSSFHQSKPKYPGNMKGKNRDYKNIGLKITYRFNPCWKKLQSSGFWCILFLIIDAKVAKVLAKVEKILKKSNTSTFKIFSFIKFLITLSKL